MKRLLVCTVLLSGPVLAQNSENEVSDEMIAFWAKHAIPLAEFVERGYGMSEPEDANSSEWCPYQAITISLSYADHPVCERLLEEMRKQGRID